jgi:hypothetical protein
LLACRRPRRPRGITGGLPRRFRSSREGIGPLKLHEDQDHEGREQEDERCPHPPAVIEHL